MLLNDIWFLFKNSKFLLIVFVNRSYVTINIFNLLINKQIEIQKLQDSIGYKLYIYRYINNLNSGVKLINKFEKIF